MPDNISDITISVGVDLSELTNQLDKATGLVEAAGKAMAAAFNGVDIGSGVAEQISKVGSAAEAAQRPITDLGSALKQTGDATHEAEGGFNAMAESLAHLGEALLVVEGLKEFATSAIEAYENIEKATISLTALAGSAGAAEEMISKLEGIAQQDALSLPAVFTAAERMTALGLTSEQTASMVQLAADAASSTNKSFEQMATMLDRIVTSGSVLARALTSLGTSSQAMADVMAVSVEEVATAFKGLTVEDRLTVMQLAMARTSGVAQQMAETFSGQMQRIQNSIDLAMAAFGEVVAEDLQPILTFVQSQLIPGLQDLAQWFGRLPEPVRQFGEAFVAVSVAAGTLAAAIAILGSTLGAIAPEFALIGLAVAAVSAALIVATEHSPELQQAWVELWNQAKGLGQAIADLAHDFLSIVAPAGDAKDSIKSFSDVVRLSAEVLGGAVRDIKDFVLWMDALATIGRHPAESINLMDAAVKDIIRDMGGYTNSAQGLATALTSFQTKQDATTASAKAWHDMSLEQIKAYEAQQHALDQASESQGKFATSIDDTARAAQKAKGDIDKLTSGSGITALGSAAEKSQASINGLSGSITASGQAALTAKANIDAQAESLVTVGAKSLALQNALTQLTTSGSGFAVVAVQASEAARTWSSGLTATEIAAAKAAAVLSSLRDRAQAALLVNKDHVKSLEDLNTEYQKNQTAVTAAKAVLDLANASVTGSTQSIRVAKEALDQYKKALETASGAHKQLQQAISAHSATLAELIQKYNESNTAVQVAAKTLAQAQAAYDAAKKSGEGLAQAQAVLIAAQSQFNSLVKLHVTSLNEMALAYDLAQTKIEATKRVLDEAKLSLDLVTAAHGNVAKATAVTEKAQEQYDAAVKAAESTVQHHAATLVDLTKEYNDNKLAVEQATRTLNDAIAADDGSAKAAELVRMAHEKLTEAMNAFDRGTAAATEKVKNHAESLDHLNAQAQANVAAMAQATANLRLAEAANDGSALAVARLTLAERDYNSAVGAATGSTQVHVQSIQELTNHENALQAAVVAAKVALDAARAAYDGTGASLAVLNAAQAQFNKLLTESDPLVKQQTSDVQGLAGAYKGAASAADEFGTSASSANLAMEQLMSMFGGYQSPLGLPSGVSSMGPGYSTAGMNETIVGGEVISASQIVPGTMLPGPAPHGHAAAPPSTPTGTKDSAPTLTIQEATQALKSAMAAMDGSAESAALVEKAYEALAAAMKTTKVATDKLTSGSGITALGSAAVQSKYNIDGLSDSIIGAAQAAQTAQDAQTSISAVTQNVSPVGTAQQGQAIADTTADLNALNQVLLTANSNFAAVSKAITSLAPLTAAIESASKLEQAITLLAQSMGTSSPLQGAITSLIQAIGTSSPLQQAITSLVQAMGTSSPLEQAITALVQAMGTLEQAITALGKALDAQSPLQQAITALTKALDSQSPLEQAITALMQALDALKQAITSLAQAMGTSSPLAQAITSLGQALGTSSPLQGAVTTLTQAFEQLIGAIATAATALSALGTGGGGGSSAGDTSSTTPMDAATKLGMVATGAAGGVFSTALAVSDATKALTSAAQTATPIFASIADTQANVAKPQPSTNLHVTVNLGGVVGMTLPQLQQALQQGVVTSLKQAGLSL